MIKIFAENRTERLIYTLDFVFHERNLTYQLYTDPEVFERTKGVKFNYSERSFQEAAQLVPATIIFDDSISVLGIDTMRFFKEDCLTFNGKVDPLGSIFYILSRMEEYVSYVEDDHGRFPAFNSVMHRFGWLDQVMCDRWAEDILFYISEHNADFNFVPERGKVKIHPTFDIDNAFAYRHKQGIRKWVSVTRDFIRGDRFRLYERQKVLKGQKRDPYDTYEYIYSLAEAGFEVNMFWLLGDYAKYDKNVSFKNSIHRKLIRKMDKVTTVGIHPSYKSNSYEFYLLVEKERLEVILNRIVEHSRQHFLKLKIPVTYPTISSMGIKHDYTMGYAAHTGYRAGTARPFKWFDLKKNKVSDLTIHPFAYMDGTLNEYLELDIEVAKERVENLYREAWKYGGDFVFIWHNETIGNYGKWKGWKEVLEFTLDLKNKIYE